MPGGTERINSGECCLKGSAPPRLRKGQTLKALGPQRTDIRPSLGLLLLCPKETTLRSHETSIDCLLIRSYLKLLTPPLIRGVYKLCPQNLGPVCEMPVTNKSVTYAALLIT